ncbi:UvrD-helicase domain-containing protein [bacterium SCSIO 12741]|nr:UvrD-helicase domain-containing protein [bacterium SCSIO 12741]
MTEIEQILEHINHGRNFLLSGGAGSGKTYTLVEVIKRVIEQHPSCKVACMTYTNAAVKEIEERVDHKNLNVTTIHDFLWDCIKNFQKELKICLVELANNSEVKAIKVNEVETVPEDYFDNFNDPGNPNNKIQYKEYLRISKGIISHDQVIALSDRMFERFPKLGDIVKDKFKFIFIDEYQDTQKEVVKIFLDHFKLSPKRNVIGFFGDSMQSIYNRTVGDLNVYVGEEEDKVREVKKEQNRRNPRLIIELANRLRTDELTQVPSGDRNAPNMVGENVKEGVIKFLYSSDSHLDNVKANLGWDFEDSKATKELNLTHNLIAEKANFQNLINIYDKDRIIEFGRRIKAFIKANPTGIDYSEMSFGDVVSSLQDGKSGRALERVSPTTSMQVFINENPELYDSALQIDYKVFSNIYVDKDQLLDDKKKDEEDINKKGSKRDDLIQHLYRLQSILWLYKSGNYNEFLRITDYRSRLRTPPDKRELKDRIESLSNVEGKTIGQVLNEADEKGICVKGDRLIRFATEKKYIYDQVMSVSYSEFQALFEYLEGRTPFSTQHKTKGTEFDNVLVVLNNGNWNDYNFEYLLDSENQRQLLVNGGSTTKSKLNSFPKILERSQKIFYVCCTRAKERLAVYYHSPSESVVNKAKEWFGEENVIDLN